jgi:hypothetical protein
LATPASTPAPSAIPAVVAGGACLPVTRTPPPGAPTYIPFGTPAPNDYVDPHIALCADRTTVAVGERVNVEALAADIGLPIYTISLRAGDAALAVPLARVNYDGKVEVLATPDLALRLEAAQGELSHLALQFRAAAPGTVFLQVSATGEIHYGYPGPARWQGGGSDPLAITVVP